MRKVIKVKRTKKKGHLFSNDNPESTVKNIGFSDKKKVLNTLKDMKYRDIVYQFQVINTMYYRGLSVLKKTNNKGKKNNLKEGLNLYKLWLDDYKLKNRRLEMMPYLPLKIINNLEFIAEYYNISRKVRGLDKSIKSDKGFLEVYREVNGNEKMLRIIPIKQNSEDITWDKYRNQYLSRRLSLIKNIKDKLYYTNGKLKGLPTKLHINMIMWGYSPDKKKISSLKYLNSIKLIFSNLDV